MITKDIHCSLLTYLLTTKRLLEKSTELVVILILYEKGHKHLAHTEDLIDLSWALMSPTWVLVFFIMIWIWSRLRRMMACFLDESFVII